MEPPTSDSLLSDSLLSPSDSLLSSSDSLLSSFGFPTSFALSAYAVEQPNLEDESSKPTSSIRGKRKRRNDKSMNTLAYFLSALEGEQVIIQLRNESSIKGIIDYVDAEINVMLKDGEFTRSKMGLETFEKLFVCGRNIRFIQLPDQLDVSATMEAHTQFLERARNLYRRGVRTAGKRK